MTLRIISKRTVVYAKFHQSSSCLSETGIHKDHHLYIGDLFAYFWSNEWLNRIYPCKDIMHPTLRIVHALRGKVAPDS